MRKFSFSGAGFLACLSIELPQPAARGKPQLPGGGAHPSYPIKSSDKIWSAVDYAAFSGSSAERSGASHTRVSERGTSVRIPTLARQQALMNKFQRSESGSSTSTHERVHPVPPELMAILTQNRAESSRRRDRPLPVKDSVACRRARHPGVDFLLETGMLRDGRWQQLAPLPSARRFVCPSPVCGSE